LFIDYILVNKDKLTLKENIGGFISLIYVALRTIFIFLELIISSILGFIFNNIILVIIIGVFIRAACN